jgi:uncharacterized protein (UPF0332 family)
MDIPQEYKEYVRYKLSKAKEAYDEAQGLLAFDAEPGYVMNSLYYAFYYPVLALLHARGVPAAMQSVSIALFEREFVKTGLIEQRFFQSLRKAFELKPKCSTPELKLITRGDVEALFTDARDFIETVYREAVGDTNKL